MFTMSIYNMQNYINNIPKVLGQSSDTKEDKQQVIPATKIDDNKELIKQAKELGLKVPRYY